MYLEYYLCTLFSGLVVKKGSPEYYLDAQFEGDRNKVWELGRDGLTGVEATLKLVQT